MAWPARGFPDLETARAELVGGAERRARDRYRAGLRASPLDGLRPAWAFLRFYLLRLGLLDGAAGWDLAWLHAAGAATEARWMHRLAREIGGVGKRGPLSEALRNLGRRVTVGLAVLLMPTPRRPVPSPETLRRVLVIRPDERVGDQLLTTPLLRALRLGLPGTELDVLAAARQAHVLPGGRADRVIPFEKRLLWSRPWAFLAALHGLRARRYDVVVDAAHWSGMSMTASLLARLVAGRHGAVVGHDRDHAARFLSVAVRHDPANLNEVRAKLELLSALHLPARGLEPETELGGDPSRARAVLAAAGVAGPYAVLNPGARMGDRRWDPAAHAAVAQGLAARGLAVLVVWGRGEEAIARGVCEASGARLAPATDLDELAALMRRARLVVSNNSGPMHLAVAVGAPTVGVFLRDDAGRWGHELPWFAAAEVWRGGEANAVLDACDDVLASPTSPSIPPPPAQEGSR